MHLKDQISNWLRLYLDDNKLESFVIGISGGIDSAVTSALCARTSKKTIVITMPIHQNPSETDRGKKHINWLQNKYPNVKEVHIDLTETYESLISSIDKQYHSKLSLANTRARIRMSTLYMIAGSSRGIVVGTGNKVEDFGVGFYTKYGDGGVDISPLADCNKTEIWEIGKDTGMVQLKELIPLEILYSSNHSSGVVGNDSPATVHTIPMAYRGSFKVIAVRRHVRHTFRT